MADVTEPRWTHVALPVNDLDRSVAFFEALTPLVLVKRNENDTLGELAAERFQSATQGVRQRSG